MARRRELTLIVGAASICIALASMASRAGDKTAMKPKSTSPPTVKLALGDNFQSVQSQSSYAFPKRDLGKVDVVAASEPVVFEYARPGCGFVFPTARSMAIAVNDGHAVDVTVSPQLKYLSPEEAVKLLERISGLLERGGWKLAKRRLTADQLRAQLDDTKQESDVTFRVAGWKCGDDEVFIEVSRHWRAGESLPKVSGSAHDFCVVSVQIANERVRARYSGR